MQPAVTHEVVEGSWIDEQTFAFDSQARELMENPLHAFASNLSEQGWSAPPGCPCLGLVVVVIVLMGAAVFD